MDDPWLLARLGERLTKPSEALEQIKMLEALDLATIDFQDLENLINAKFPIIPYNAGIIKEGNLLFRARINEEIEPYNTFQDIYVKAAEKIQNYGRAHKPHERIFYSASNFKLASLEVLQSFKTSIDVKSKVAFLTVGVWRVKEDLHIASIIDSKALHEIRKDIAGFYSENQKLLNNGNLTDDIVKANNLICQFFSDQFTKKDIKSEHDYKISAFYTSTLRKMNSFVAKKYYRERFDGINYPSVANKYRGDNQALFIESADKKLELINALQVVCSNFNFDEGTFVPGIMHEAEIIGEGKIRWKAEIYRPS